MSAKAARHWIWGSEYKEVRSLCCPARQELDRLERRKLFCYRMGESDVEVHPYEALHCYR